MAEPPEIGFRSVDALAEQIAREDIEKGLGDWFEPRGDDDVPAFVIRSDLTASGELRAGRIVAVPWRYRGMPRPQAWGVAAERGAVEFDGVTFVDLESEQCSRLIDWHGAFMQLGVAAAGHIVTEPPRTESTAETS